MIGMGEAQRGEPDLPRQDHLVVGIVTKHALFRANVPGLIVGVAKVTAFTDRLQWVLHERWFGGRTMALLAGSLHQTGYLHVGFM